MIENFRECNECKNMNICIGTKCNDNSLHLFCDNCFTEVDKLYDVNGEQICGNCVLDMFDEIKAERRLVV